jgi:hypothetical protein
VPERWQLTLIADSVTVRVGAAAASFRALKLNVWVPERVEERQVRRHRSGVRVVIRSIVDEIDPPHRGWGSHAVVGQIEDVTPPTPTAPPGQFVPALAITMQVCVWPASRVAVVLTNRSRVVVVMASSIVVLLPSMPTSNGVNV